MPFTRSFVIRSLGIDLTKLFTKFEVSNITHNKDMKGDTKCRKWGGLG